MATMHVERRCSDTDTVARHHVGIHVVIHVAIHVGIHAQAAKP